MHRLEGRELLPNVDAIGGANEMKPPDGKQPWAVDEPFAAGRFDVVVERPESLGDVGGEDGTAVVRAHRVDCASLLRLDWFGRF
jgi:hypothetical protein